MQKALEGNLRRNGQVENLIVRELDDGTYEVVNGNHRLDAMRAVGIDMATCWNLGKISPAEAKRVAIETNETRFQADPVLLAQLANSLLEEYEPTDLAETTPWTAAELADMSKLTEFSWDEFLGAPPPTEELAPIDTKNKKSKPEEEEPPEDLRLYSMTIHGLTAEMLEEIRRYLRAEHQPTDAAALVAICRRYLEGDEEEEEESD